MGFLQRSEVRALTTLAVLVILIFFTEFRIANTGMGWKGEDSPSPTSIGLTNIKWIQWLRVARNYQIRVGLKDGERETFDGFSRDVSSPSCSHRTNPTLDQDHDKLAALFKQHFSIALETKEISFRGWNWGSTDFQGALCPTDDTITNNPTLQATTLLSSLETEPSSSCHYGTSPIRISLVALKSR
jgi:hypothetical protein